MRKTLQTATQTTGSITAAAQGAALTIGRAETISALIVVTGTGTGTVQWQVSNDGTNWANYGSSVSITGTPGNFQLEDINPSFLFMRLSYTVSATNYNATATISLKGTA